MDSPARHRGLCRNDGSVQGIARTACRDGRGARPGSGLRSGASDGTHKWLLRLDDGNCIETVFIPEKDRGTLCISSQVGCALDCTFCSTARQGFNRNLTRAEIIGQLWLANRRLTPAPAADGKHAAAGGEQRGAHGHG
jgi:hypothetical protein